MTTAIATRNHEITGLESPSYGVISTPPTTTPDNFYLIDWSRRSTEKNPVAVAERYRGALVPENQLKLPDGATTSKFAALLQATILQLAADRFAAWARDNIMAREIPASHLELNSVLAFWAEERQRTVIDGDKLMTWFQASLTCSHLPPAKRPAWIKAIGKLAAPGYLAATTKDNAAKIIATLEPEDSESPEAVFIITRCTKVIEAVPEEL